MKKYLPFLFFITPFFNIQTAQAATAGDYKSVKSGNWLDATTWQRFDGKKWVAAMVTPTSADGVITIQTGDTVIINNQASGNPVHADQVSVNLGAVLHLMDDRGLFFLDNGPGTDLSVKGRLIIDALADINNLVGGTNIDYKGDTLEVHGGIGVFTTFDGVNAQTIIGDGYFSRIVINNIKDLTATGRNSFRHIEFIKGKVHALDAIFFDKFYEAFTGQSATSYIDGDIGLFCDTSSIIFNLPTGKGNSYLPVVLTVKLDPLLGGQEVALKFSIHNGAAPGLALPNGISSVYNAHYYTVESLGGQDVAIVAGALQLSYNAADGITDNKRLCMLESSAAGWLNIGGGGTGLPSGKIAAGIQFQTPGVFVLANLASTILPLDKSVTSGNTGLPDVYKLTTNADGRMRLALAVTKAVTIRLLDGDSLTSLGVQAVTPATPGTLVMDGLAKGTYFVKITPVIPNQPYNYTLADSLFVPDQANNIEPDSTRALAQQLNRNSSTTGHIGYYYKSQRDTVDWYKITTSTDGIIKLSITSANANAVSLKLFDNNGTTNLGSASSAAGNTSVLMKDGLAAGTYFITVSSLQSNRFAPYTLADSLFTPDQANVTEKDSTKALARILALNSSLTGHVGYYFNNHRDTVDWYKITTNALGTLTLNLTSANNNTVSLTLFDNTGTTKIDSLNAAGNTTAMLNKPALPKGIYFAVVSSLNKSLFEPYVLSNNFASGPGFTGNSIPALPGNTSAIAKKGILDKDIIIYPNPAARQFRLQLNGTVTGGNTAALFLRDVNGKTVWARAKSNISSLNNLPVDVSKLPNGIYFLEIIDENKKVTIKKIIIER